MRGGNPALQPGNAAREIPDTFVGFQEFEAVHASSFQHLIGNTDGARMFSFEPLELHALLKIQPFFDLHFKLCALAAVNTTSPVFCPNQFILASAVTKLTLRIGGRPRRDAIIVVRSRGRRDMSIPANEIFPFLL